MYRIGLFVPLCLVLCAGVSQAQNPESLAYVSGGSSKAVVRILESGPEEIFSAKKGFRPEGIGLDSFGRLFVCDSSNSQIHLLEQTDDLGDWVLTTIHDRSSAESPTVEKPVSCTIVGRDLFIGESSGAGDFQGAWVMRDAAVTPSSGPFQPPELLVPIVASSNDKITDITFAPNASVLLTRGDEILIAFPPDYAAFQPFIADLPAKATGVAVSSVGEVVVAMGTIGRIDLFDPNGIRCGSYVDVSPLRPSDPEFNLADVLYFTAPAQAGGKGGDTFVAMPQGGAATNQCDFPSTIVPATPVTPVAPDGNFGIALTGSSVSRALTFTGPGALSAKQCAATFTLDPEFVFLNPDCEVTVTCRQMPIEEFETRTADFFPGTECFQIPLSNGDCTETVVEGAAECFDGVTEIEWLFFVQNSVPASACPGLGYAEFPNETAPYSENILIDYDEEPVPQDPGLRAKKLNFGSGVVGFTNAPNRAPQADAGEDQLVECGVTTVTIDGSASDDTDPIDRELGLTFAWTGQEIPDGADDNPSFEVAVADLVAGPNVFTLTVTDSGSCPGGVLADSDSMTVTANPDVAGPTIHGVEPEPGLLWPPNHEMIPVTLTVDATDDCGAISCRIVSVTMNDDDEGNGAGTFPDWEFDGAPVVLPDRLNLLLRAERSEGSNSVDDTRVYTIDVACDDEAGNSTAASTEILVFSDQGS